MNTSMISNEELNRVVHEQVVKECWHEPAPMEPWRCRKCDKHLPGNLVACDPKGSKSKVQIARPDYCSSWQDYGKLIAWVKQSERYGAFIAFLHNKLPGSIANIIEPRFGCELVVEFFVKDTL